VTGTYRIERLGQHDRQSFTCGADDLDRYFRERITQDARRRIASAFVAIGPQGDIAGYYTLAPTAIALDALPPDRAKKLPRYPVVPAFLLGRLAIASGHQGKRLGAALLADAILRATRAEISGYAMVVDAKDETAARFYEHLEFMRLPGDPLRLIRVL
jgi:GNAT superfamily N-acetyltransferase